MKFWWQFHVITRSLPYNFKKFSNFLLLYLRLQITNRKLCNLPNSLICFLMWCLTINYLSKTMQVFQVPSHNSFSLLSLCSTFPTFLAQTVKKAEQVFLHCDLKDTFEIWQCSGGIRSSGFWDWATYVLQNLVNTVRSFFISECFY